MDARCLTRPVVAAIIAPVVATRLPAVVPPFLAPVLGAGLTAIVPAILAPSLESARSGTATLDLVATAGRRGRTLTGLGGLPGSPTVAVTATGLDTTLAERPALDVTSALREGGDGDELRRDQQQHET